MNIITQLKIKLEKSSQIGKSKKVLERLKKFSSLCDFDGLIALVCGEDATYLTHFRSCSFFIESCRYARDFTFIDIGNSCNGHPVSLPATETKLLRNLLWRCMQALKVKLNAAKPKQAISISSLRPLLEKIGLITFTGWFLNYPVVFVSSGPTNANLLSGIEIFTYSICVRGSSDRSYEMIGWSVPAMTMVKSKQIRLHTQNSYRKYRRVLKSALIEITRVKTVTDDHVAV